MAVDPVQAQRVDVVQRPELALGVPPAVGEFSELLQLCGIGVHRIRGQGRNYLASDASTG
jgi:hypothetical protein